MTCVLGSKDIADWPRVVRLRLNVISWEGKGDNKFNVVSQATIAEARRSKDGLDEHQIESPR